jgi:hypothetical protein
LGTPTYKKPKAFCLPIEGFFIVIFLLPIPSSAGAQWWGAKGSKQEKILKGSWQFSHLMDWGTTLETAQPGKYEEYNFILGKHLSRGKINLYMASGPLLSLAVTHILPPKARPYFQGITIGFFGGCAINNFSLGLRLKF